MTFGDIEVGIDLIEVERIRRALERWKGRFEERLFTEQERTYCRSRVHPHLSFAARFAAKEATMKALGIGWPGIGWQEIEVVRGQRGKPSLQLTGRALARFEELGGQCLRVSLTHTETYAFAEVLLLLD